MNTNTEAVIMNPIAEHCGTIIHEREDGVLCFIDGKDNIHIRNTKISKRERLSCIKQDIEWYSQNNWLN